MSRLREIEGYQMVKRLKAPPQLIVFILGFATAAICQGAKSRFSYRPVQYLTTRDRAHFAVLERVELFDLTFRVKLDGQVIYYSPELTPNRSLPFRETLLWDASSKYLIFEVIGHRFFGYDVQQKRVLSNRELLRAKVNPVTPRQAGLERHGPH